MGIFEKLKNTTKHYSNELKFPSRVTTTSKLLHWIIHIIDLGMSKYVCTAFIAVYITLIPHKCSTSLVIYKKYASIKLMVTLLESVEARGISTGKYCVHWYRQFQDCYTY